MKRTRLVLLVALAISSALYWAPAARAECPRAAAVERWYVPRYAKLQTGGYLGFLTVGSGWSLAQTHVEIELLYGWVPASLGGTSVHSLTLRSFGRSPGWCFGPGFRWTYLYGGPAVLFALGDQFFLRVPERYHDRRYYRRTAMHWLATLGTELALPFRSPHIPLQHALYAELSALDDYLFSWLKSASTVSFASIFSTTLGYRVRF